MLRGDAPVLSVHRTADAVGRLAAHLARAACAIGLATEDYPLEEQLTDDVREALAKALRIVRGQSGRTQRRA